MRDMFSKPANPQAGSRLMQLSAEIRLKIFRLLSKQLQPIRSDSQRDDQDQYVDADQADVHVEDAACPGGATLSSQALRTCQLFYQEGSHVLYKGNTLSLYCRSGVYSYQCSVLDLKIDYADDLSEIPQYKAALLDYTELDSHCFRLDDMFRDSQFYRACYKALCKSKYHGHVRRGNTELSLKRLCSIFDRFDTFEVVAAHIWLGHPTMLVCRTFQDLLDGKNVAFRICRVREIGSSGEDEDADADAGEDAKKLMYLNFFTKEFESCRILRCASLSFPDIENRNSKDDKTSSNIVSSVRLERSRCARLKDEVCGFSDVCDTFTLWQIFTQSVVKPLASIAEHEFEPKCKEELDLLREHAFAYRESDFMSVRRSLLRKAHRWIDVLIEWSDICAGATTSNDDKDTETEEDDGDDSTASKDRDVAMTSGGEDLSTTSEDEDN